MGPYEDTLQTIAELSIALAGFTGIVAALGRRAQGEWEPHERARLESLLWAAVGGVVFSMAPSVAASSSLSEATIWRVGNGVFGFLHVAAAAWFFRRWSLVVRSLVFRSPDRARILTASAPIIALVVAALILGQFAVALGFLPGLAPFFYLAMLLWILVIGLIQFVFLLVQTRTTS